MKVIRFYRRHRLAVLLTTWAIFSLVFVFLARSVAFRDNFHDETDHVAVGYFVYRHHLKLYRDLITIHQPFPIIIGGALAQVLPQTTLYAFISGLRLLVSLFWVGSGFLLVWRFRERGWLTSLAACLYSFRYFGFFVLAETLVWPAVVYLVFVCLEKLFPARFPPSRRYRWAQDCLWGTCCGYLIFNLLPLAPFIILATLIYLWPVWPLNQRFWRPISGITTGFLLVTACLLLFISPLDWWDATILNFLRYWSEDIHLGLWETSLHWLTWFFYPLFSGFYHWRDPHFLLWSVLILAAFVYSWRASRRRFIKLFAAYFLVFSLNNRVSALAVSFAEGFHLLPYLVGLLAWTSTAWLLLWPRQSRRVRLDILVITFIWWAGVGTWLAAPSTRQTDYEIKFLPEQSLANVINILKRPGDTLLTGEDGYGYLNLLTDLPFADRQNFHLVWSWRSPVLRQDFLDTFASRPPAFVYFPDHTGHGMPDLLHEIILPRDYVAILNPAGHPSDLFVRADRVGELDDATIASLESTYYRLDASASGVLLPN